MNNVVVSERGVLLNDKPLMGVAKVDAMITPEGGTFNIELSPAREYEVRVLGATVYMIHPDGRKFRVVEEVTG